MQSVFFLRSSFGIFLALGNQDMHSNYARYQNE